MNREWVLRGERTGSGGPRGVGVEEAVLLKSGGEIWLPLAVLGSSGIFQGQDVVYFQRLGGCHTSLGVGPAAWNSIPSCFIYFLVYSFVLSVQCKKCHCLKPFLLAYGCKCIVIREVGNCDISFHASLV